jgi:hypothetical protein
MWSERSTASTFFTSQRTSDREAEMLDLRVSTCGPGQGERDRRRSPGPRRGRFRPCRKTTPLSGSVDVLTRRKRVARLQRPYR